jgi:hypothetical protein
MSVKMKLVYLGMTAVFSAIIMLAMPASINLVIFGGIFIVLAFLLLEVLKK